MIRFSDGRLYDKEDFIIKDAGESPDLPSLRSEFIQQYYTMRERIPPVVALDGEAEDQELLAMWLTEKRKDGAHKSAPEGR